MLKRMNALGLFFATVLWLLTASFAYAQADDNDEARSAAEKAKHRRYPGGRDEQELTVQTVLPVMTRYPEAPKVPTAPAPESDTDTHD